jgi:signal transduction histidine kinase
VNFFEKVSSLIRAGSGLEDLGRGLARALDHGHLIGFVLYGAAERCLVTVPYLTAEANGRLRDEFEKSDWRGRPREAFLAAFEKLQISTGEVGEGIRWAFLGAEESPIGAFACVRDPAAPPPSESERKVTDFFFQLSGELAAASARGPCRDRDAAERDFLLDALNQIGRLVFSRPDPSRLLPSLLKIALDVARTEVGSILLERDGRFPTEIEWGLAGELIDGVRFVPEMTGIIERLRDTLEPVIVDDVSGPTVRLPDGYPVRMSILISIPLLVGDRLVGILNVASGEEGREMLSSTVAALTTVAGIIASTVENARLSEAFAARSQAAHQGVAAEQSLLRQVIGGLREGVIISDPAGRIAVTNPAAEEMLGLGGAGGRRFPERNVVTLRPFFSWLRERWASCTGVEEEEYRLAVHPPATFAVRIAPVRGEGDRFRHMTLVREVERRASVPTVAPPRIAAEIEPPLAAARAAMALSPPGREGDFASRIAWRSLERLAATAEDLRDAAIAGRGEPETRSRFSLVEVASLVALESRDALAEKSITLRGPGVGPIFVTADRLRIRKALARTIEAVIRWTAEGGWIDLRVEPTVDGASVLITFQQASWAQGFEKLFPEPDGPGGAADPEGEGMPLGLTVARRTIEMHGGRISAGSTKDTEGRLSIVLPAVALQGDGGVEDVRDLGRIGEYGNERAGAGA